MVSSGIIVAVVVEYRSKQGLGVVERRPHGLDKHRGVILLSTESGLVCPCMVNVTRKYAPGRSILYPVLRTYRVIPRAFGLHHTPIDQLM